MWRLRSQYPLPPDNAALLPALALDHNFHRMVDQLLDHFEETVRRQCQLKLDLHGIEQFAPTDEWTFLGSVFFSMTVFTTIGKWVKFAITFVNTLFSESYFQCRMRS